MVAWLLVATLVAMLPVYLVLSAGAGSYWEGWFSAALGVGGVLASAAVGLLIALRRPRNPIGWLLLGNALALEFAGLAYAYAAYELANPGSLPGARLAAIWDTSGWPLIFAAVVAIAFVFPDGRLPSRRWRPAVVGGASSFVLMVIGDSLSGETLDAPFEDVEPAGVLPEIIHGPMQLIGLAGMIATFVAAAVALVSRFRDATGVLQLQLKWIAYAAALIPVSIVVGTLDSRADAPGWPTSVALAAVLIAIPAAIGVAVLRYRLYEIERLISATLVYGALTAVLGGTFAAVTLGLGVALGRGSPFPTAAATLAVALAFRPLRTRIQTAVVQRFDPSRYEGLAEVDRFLADLRLGQVEPEAIGEVLSDSLSDPLLELYFWLPRDSAHADASGRLVRELPSAPAGRTPVRRGELLLATLVHDPRLLERASPLEAVIMRAGLPIEIARLRVEVRRQLAEVEESRARIVAATYEERRRLERDLHDGAQQRLVALGLDLRHLQHDLRSAGGASAGAALDPVVAGLAEAVAELRELAHGVRPAALDDGLAAALRELASRTPLRTDVETTHERFGGEVEAAAYFVASEALTNAVKHASGSQVVVRAGRSEGDFVLSVSDDGCGGAVPAAGSGLVGLGDRVAALGGRLDVFSDANGTSVIARFPCE